jgi:DNA polymerase-3 subunit alpha
MSLRFPKHPEWIENTVKIAERIEDYEICEAPQVVEFPLPLGGSNEADYLASLVYEGMKNRWGEQTPPEIVERINFELHVIKTMGFPSYFLIVHDYVEAARRMGVWVGPGRGSAAGSAVAYALGITSVDPIKHKLLFERFLNPDRISMPDIDIDFEDADRGKIVEYLCEKYGRDRVANVVTFARMAPRSAIKDVARVLEYPIHKANELAGLVPDEPRMTFRRALNGSAKFRQVYESGESVQKKILRIAEKIEGCVRQHDFF